MQPFTVHRGTAAPLTVRDVDTDQIIPARFCAAVTKEGLADALFADWRSAQPDFVLNRPAHTDATVLVAGENFGAGSSREWAVWALQEFGFRAIVATSYGDIFRANALKNGLLVVELTAEEVAEIWHLIDGDPTAEMTVDLVHRTITIAGIDYAFDLDDYTRWRLVNGLDDIALTEAHHSDIDRFERQRRDSLPTLVVPPAQTVDR